MNLSEDMMEDFNYIENDLETLKRRFFSLDDFLRANNKEAAVAIKEISSRKGLLTDPAALTGAIRVMGSLVSQTDTDDDKEWSSLYAGLFDSSPCWQESHYIPQPGEMKDITLLCMKEHKRIRTDVPEGAIA